MADITLSYKNNTIKEISASGTTTLNTAGTYCEDDITLEYTKPSGTYQAKTNINPTTSSQTITPDSGYDALSSVQINAMPTGSYTLSATKGTVSNNSVSVTPSVIINGGYISSQSLDGNDVTVTASELVSGTKSISANGTGIDVTNYASVNVAVPTANVESNKNATLEGGSTIITPSSGYDAMEQVTANVPEIQLPPSMPSSFLNTDWVINENPSLNALIGMDVIINYGEYTDDYYLDPYDGTELYFVEQNGDTDGVLVYSSVEGWENNLYRRITIVGGSSITNPTFVAWLHSNAVPVGTSADFNYNFFQDAGIVEIATVNSGYLSNSNAADIVLPNQGHSNPTYYSFGNTTGNITFYHYQPSGFTLGGASFGSYQLPVKSAQTYTPTTTNQVINYAQWLTGSQTIKGDANLIAENIKKDVSIFGVTGTYEGSSGIGTLLNTTSLGPISTTSTSATSLSKSVAVSDIYGYDALLMITSVDSITNNRHTSTGAFIWLTASSNQSTQNGARIATAIFNTKISSAGVTTTYSSTTAYGIYPESCSIGTATGGVGVATFNMYRRYNSSYTGTINGSYTTRVYGIKVCDLIGG